MGGRVEGEGAKDAAGGGYVMAMGSDVDGVLRGKIVRRDKIDRLAAAKGPTEFGTVAALHG